MQLFLNILLNKISANNNTAMIVRSLGSGSTSISKKDNQKLYPRHLNNSCTASDLTGLETIPSMNAFFSSMKVTQRIVCRADLF